MRSQPIRSATLFSALVATFLVAGAASAQSHEDFTQARFEALQAEDALILVDIWADWCPTCAVQQDVLTEFRTQHPDVPLHTLTVNFDSQKQWVKHFGAPRQSTFVLFRGEERIWFSVAETRRDEIFAELLAAANPE